MQAKGYRIDYNDWHAHVHGVLPYERCLARDERMRAIIKASTNTLMRDTSQRAERRGA